MGKYSRKKILALLAVGAFVVGTAWISGRRVKQAAWQSVRLPRHSVILDAGHGGEDGGAVSITGVPESEINLAIVKRMDQLLGFYGACPILVRESDVSIYDAGCTTLREKKVSDIRNRVQLIEQTPNALVVSVHQNSFPGAAYHGAQVFFREGEESTTLADRVQEALETALEAENVRTAAEIPDTVYLMEHITCPAVLVECGFLSNREEEAKLRTGEYQQKVAICISAGVLKYERESGTMPS